MLIVWPSRDYHLDYNLKYIDFLAKYIAFTKAIADWHVTLKLMNKHKKSQYFRLQALQIKSSELLRLWPIGLDARIVQRHHSVPQLHVQQSRTRTCCNVRDASLLLTTDVPAYQRIKSLSSCKRATDGSSVTHAWVTYRKRFKLTVLVECRV